MLTRLIMVIISQYTQTHKYRIPETNAECQLYLNLKEKKKLHWIPIS